MTKDEFEEALSKFADKLMLDERYEKVKSKSNEAYAELVKKWGRRAANTVLIVGALAVAFFLGTQFG